MRMIRIMQWSIAECKYLTLTRRGDSLANENVVGAVTET